MESLSQVKGLVFNIQKYSVNDGPGIRTVVFMKGCPLRCQWCANPESQENHIQVLWDEKKCLQCGTCVSVCPESAVRKEDQGSSFAVRIDGKLCVGCGTCVRNCPAHALKTEGEWRTVEDVVAVCLQDLPFYEESNGGITLSGGEVLSSPDFTVALADMLHEKHLHVALETTGFASSAVFERVIAHADLLLFDIKQWNEKKHREGTGVSNLPILANLKTAISSGIEVLPRIPVIPGFNASLEDAEGFSNLLNDHGIHKAQLLPFHQFGENKYHLLNRPYAYQDIPALHPEDLEEYLHVFTRNDIAAFI